MIYAVTRCGCDPLRFILEVKAESVRKRIFMFWGVWRAGGLPYRLFINCVYTGCVGMGEYLNLQRRFRGMLPAVPGERISLRLGSSRLRGRRNANWGRQRCSPQHCRVTWSKRWGDVFNAPRKIFGGECMGDPPLASLNRSPCQRLSPGRG